MKLTFLIILFAAIFLLKKQRGLQAVARLSGQTVLDGSKSYDPNPGGHLVAFHWSLIKGNPCKVVYPDSVITPVTGLTRGVRVFRLVVRSSENLSASDSTTITVKVN